MSTTDVDVKKYIEDLFRLLNGGPDKSKVSDDMLRGLVRNFQEQYNFKKEEEIDFVKTKFATKNSADIISRGGASLVTTPEQKALVISTAKTTALDNFPKPQAEAINADIKLATDREFSKLVKRLSYALSNGYLDANRFLIWAIALSSTITINYDLILISLILRYGNAERNMYLLVPEYGNVHLLVYTVLELEKKKGVTGSKFRDTSIDNSSINSILFS
jgi:hypothetical protein